MKFKTIFKRGAHLALPSYIQLIKSIVLSVLILAGTQMPLQAQQEQEEQEEQTIQPSWWFGVAGGANVNFYRGSTQQLNDALTVPTAFHDGLGVGLYLGPLIEFHRPESRWGFMLQAAYDNRNGTFDQVNTPCDCPADLYTNLTYVSVEPSLRIAPFKSDFYLFGGPRFAYNYDKPFIYEQGLNPAYPDQVAVPNVESDLSNINEYLISMQIGAGYDIHLTSKDKRSQVVLSPFVSYQPYFGQDPRSIETWNITTLRAGIALKFGWTHKDSTLNEDETPDSDEDETPDSDEDETPDSDDNETMEPDDSKIKFLVYSPKNVPVDRRVTEIFPIRNYVFFDLGSDQIPDRYVLLDKSQVKGFKEDRLEVFIPKELSGRSDREMVVYYNILNILGDRMGESPNASVTLTGASMDGKVDGKAMAESVKKYLVDIFEIAPSRIITEGVVKPDIPSEQPGGTKELKLLREDDHRVSITSSSPALLMEYQTGPNIALKPIELVTTQSAPLDSYVTIWVDGAQKVFSSWSLEVKDKNGRIKNMGPYTEEQIRISGRTILGNNPDGQYHISMIGKMDNGQLITRDTTINMVLWTPPEQEMGIRYSVIYELDNDVVIRIYEKYLTEIITPQIPVNGTVIIHGYTDIIGDANYNQKLSLARANDVRSVLEKSLKKANRTDVKFQVLGFGENEYNSPYGNKYPEERFYNRTVIIDIIPAK